MTDSCVDPKMQEQRSKNTDAPGASSRQLIEFGFPSTMWSSNYAGDELENRPKFGAKIDNLWVLQRVLRVHIGRSNGGVVKPSLLFECLAFALSVRVRRKPTTFFALEKKIRRNKERRNTDGTHTPRERPIGQFRLTGWIASYLNTLRRSTEFVANERSNKSAADIEV
ncbi:hypothetical protein PROFUN_13026 [Planoprotostelium fungivorum]|uniref:Uncharacterized protein n=1 Tax=Planoprotostelium fungivorum TaxID=1890364 RepID=A0A2P6N5K4_9EUKA|nr:hypothetical protein PROFUN_13026 [Planoprotostelium fungivorum]